MLIPSEIKQKPIEYLLLVCFMVIAASLFITFRFDPHSQRRVIYAASAGYVFWSLLHHYRRGDLQLSIVIEYLLLALLAIVVTSGTLF